MKIVNRVILSILIAIWTIEAIGMPNKGDTLRYEILLSKRILKEEKLNDNFINSLDITSKRLILLSSKERFYLLGWGGIVPFGNKVFGNIGSFAFTPDSLLMTVRNDELCYFDAKGGISKLYKLPNQSMGICAGKYLMYVYDRNEDQNEHALYAIAKGGKYTKLFEVPSPITSAVEMNTSILFAARNGLYSFKPKNKELKALAIVKKGQKIQSIAVDSLKKIIYFSTDSTIYALKDSNKIILGNKYGGTLRYFKNGLLVFNPERELLVRISGIGDKLTLSQKPAENTKKTTETLTNSTIINMVKTNLSDNIIINVINSSKVNFDLSVDAMINLSNQHVSSSVIRAMKNAMKNKGN